MGREKKKFLTMQDEAAPHNTKCLMARLVISLPNLKLICSKKKMISHRQYYFIRLTIESMH